MPTLTRCTHTDLYPDQCGHCLGHPGALKPDPGSEPLTAVTTVRAWYRSVCPNPDHPGRRIEPGETVGLVAGIGWCCADCIGAG